MPEAKAVLREQLSVSWALLDYHLQRLEDADLFWEPARLHWTVRRVDGAWVPDFADVEPDPVPVPTAAWVTWHIGWWWSTALAHLVGTQVPARQDVDWPGDARSTVSWLHRIHDSWQQAFADCADLGAEAAFPWPAGSGRTKADLCAWVTVELTKNAAELGQLLLLRRAGAAPRPER